MLDLFVVLGCMVPLLAWPCLSLGSSGGSRVVGAGLGGRVLNDAAQAEPLAGARVHDEGVVAELALRVQAACMRVRTLSSHDRQLA